MEVGEIKEELSALIADALSALPIARFVADCTPNILPSQPKFGDFQWKDCMVMFKSVPAGHFDSAPALAAAIVFHLPKSDIIQSVSVAPGKVGIINFRLYDVLKSAARPDKALCPLCGKFFLCGRSIRNHLSGKHEVSGDELTRSCRKAEENSLQVSVTNREKYAAQKPSDDQFAAFCTTLGIAEENGRDTAAIKVAFRKLAMQHHPDRNPANAQVASLKFREVVNAYQQLLNPRELASADVPLNLEHGLECCRTGDLKSLEVLLASGWDISTQDKSGANGLDWAAGSGHACIVSLLLKQSKSRKLAAMTGKRSRCSLHWAARNNHIEVCKILLANGADIDEPTRDGTSAFHWAVWQGHFETASFLKGEGANWKAKNSYGCNAIHWAALAGRLEMCQWLHGMGLDITILNNQGHGALHKAGWRGHRSVCEWLQESVGIDRECKVTDDNGYTASGLAALAGYEETAAWLLRHRGITETARSPQPLDKAQVSTSNMDSSAAFPHQLTSAEAAKIPFDTFMDLIPTSDGVLLRHVSADMDPLTYAQFKEFARTLKLEPFGISRCDRVAVVLPNGPEMASVFLCLSAKCAVCPLNTHLTAAEFMFELQDLPATALVVTKASAADPDHPSVICARDLGVTIIWFVADAKLAGTFTLEPERCTAPQAIKYGSQVGVSQPSRSDIALVLHTSGTTKLPKVRSTPPRA
jgi:ankyrin repeat protein